MKVKPWASTEETLAALYTTLAARHRCGIFWDSLRTLLQNLAGDLKARTTAFPGTLIDNEVLDSERYERLLDEIRQVLAQEQEATSGSFRHLASALSAPALGLLLFLGGVASVSCDHSGLRQSKQDAALADTNAPGPDTRAVPAPDTQPPRADVSPDGPPRIVLPPIPDVAPGPDAVASGADGGAVTIADIMDSCNVSTTDQDAVLACLQRLRESWTTGLAQALAGVACTIVNNELSCFAHGGQACWLGSAEEFVVGKTRICQPVIIYAGVRFV